MIITDCKLINDCRLARAVWRRAIRGYPRKLDDGSPHLSIILRNQNGNAIVERTVALAADGAGMGGSGIIAAYIAKNESALPVIAETADRADS